MVFTVRIAIVVAVVSGDCDSVYFPDLQHYFEYMTQCLLFSYRKKISQARFNVYTHDHDLHCTRGLAMVMTCEEKCRCLQYKM